MSLEILKQCLNGSATAQKELYDNYKVNMFILCQRYFSDRNDAQDALQEGFIKVFRDLYQFDDSKGYFSGWIKKIFINTCLELLRKKRIDFNQLEEYFEVADVQYDVLSSLNVKDLTKMIQTLPLGYRTVFNLYVIEGFKHYEIAEKLNITENTSKTQLMKAKNHLKKLLETVLK